jgi:hypothetical protein
MQVATCNGQASLEILLDSGADICAAGPHAVRPLTWREHGQPGTIPGEPYRAVNGSILDPVGMIPNVSLCTNGKPSRTMSTYTPQLLGH